MSKYYTTVSLFVAADKLEDKLSNPSWIQTRANLNRGSKKRHSEFNIPPEIGIYTVDSQQNKLTAIDHFQFAKLYQPSSD